jgi:hypothetical protein
MYDDDPFVRISYPDLIQEGARLFVTETQKEVARVHELDPAFVRGLWSCLDSSGVALEGLLMAAKGEDLLGHSRLALPELPMFCRRDQGRADYGTEQLRTGITVEVWVRFNSLEAGQVLLDNRREDGRGFCLQTKDAGTVELVLNDGRTENRWSCDRGSLQVNEWQHIVAIVDAGPRIISFIVNGVLCDGAADRQFGWGRFSPNLREVNGGPLRIEPSLRGNLEVVRIYDRPLRTFEAVGNYGAGESGSSECH